MTVLDRALAAGDAGVVAGERQERPDPEVPEKARRRSFTAQYKLDVVAEYDAAAIGEKGAVLRREGLYSSHVIEWRRARDAGALAGPARRRGARRLIRGMRRSPGCRRRRPSWSRSWLRPASWWMSRQNRRRLGDDLRGRGHRTRAELVTDEAIALLAPRIGTRAACAASGVPQATWYRRHRASPALPRRAPYRTGTGSAPRPGRRRAPGHLGHAALGAVRRHRPGRGMGDAAG